MIPRHLGTLLAVIDEGSFEAAAGVLGVTPSAVSQRVKALEASVGRVLVRRGTPTAATEAGEVLVQTARRMHVLEAETDARLGGHISALPVPVAVNADSLATWFRPVLAAAAAWDGAGLRITVEDERHSLAMLRRGDCMGAITTDADAVAGCVVEALGTQRYLPVAAPEVKDGLDAGRWTWRTLPAVRYGPKDTMETPVLRARLGEHAAPDPRRRVTEIPSFEGINDAVVAGLGWAVIPESCVEGYVAAGTMAVLSGDVVEVPLFWQHWRLESTVLGRVGDAVHAAAAAGLA
ncbi:ArgP/LysG family DNA-binding transcriptional regulator [Corynebacterium bovis]|uniref:LysR family transcriptional regulator (Chromosome initiation inhibitor) n=1 Tax=Corynebacterium bovis DSM 20582 = CIP 54.80 TaxID=927655 RepID=A0A8H9Y7A0_9CORY|nr:ArgP/LysG family DNA-binding transcriptional regulator [Corynebacterium bovis]MBB3116327.1 LysR family transcriptional regulator (chromosome initiation inhibitor) [Corynebacterium bovis DSM 20582 = CIP 54.80]MDK8510243.1 ArgP/LysG family DNA-binding transcriptional regulator [Corynebacterium bovis]QQC47577.1 ArgP/LysG family DNA-binding transcriptional regulator [Corynebacterium bovis]WJY77356.1 putative HTH-type transcriptional regulator [Corynebacterium bovis DSM 20582 = CIP 54.80]